MRSTGIPQPSCEETILGASEVCSHTGFITMRAGFFQHIRWHSRYTRTRYRFMLAFYGLLSLSIDSGARQPTTYDFLSQHYERSTVNA